MDTHGRKRMDRDCTRPWVLVGGEVKFGMLEPSGVAEILNLPMTDVRGRIQQWLLNLDSDAILSGITPMVMNT
jgi:hypothetical protein